ncbi:PREDICTED: uncharacterized protein LOC109211623 [Nicotiana attenuata]|uniref:uncharacterized protein LOC109211623 n=1 Tax=Nicotiana attenuata TaxID=49451 RepID=UPI0009056507|nr:PREDICTED: uncharacterized protein LOC109211623 [Nicotiana attenuata]
MSLSKEQYGQIVSLLQHFQMGNTGENSTSANMSSGAYVNFAGLIACTSSIDFDNPSCKCFSAKTDLWILDFRASHHMTFNKTHLQNIVSLPYPLLVKLPNGYKVKVTEIGDVSLTPIIVLYKVLFIPSFKFNLVSISSLAVHLKCVASFFDTSCLLQAHSLKRPLEIGYPFGTKGYKVLILATKKIHISRDVSFYESIFPFTFNTTVNNIPPIFPNAPFIDNPPDHTDTCISQSISDQENTNFPNLDASPVTSSLISSSYETQVPVEHLQDMTSPQQSLEEPLEAAMYPSWQSAMTQEFEALYANNSCDLVPLPKGKYAIGCRWVYKVKHRADGIVERYKARLVVKGYTQQAGVDYTETFSPVVKMTTVRSLIAIAATKKWVSLQVEQVSLWTETGKQTMGSSIIFVAVYVDDVLLTGTDFEEINQLKAFLYDKFKIKDLGQLHYFLGLAILYKLDGIVISQIKFVLDLLKEYECLHYPALTSPIDPIVKLKAKEGAPLSDHTFYRKLVGKLNFLTNTRLDIAYGVQHFSQFLQDPREPHLQAAYHMLRYLKKDLTLGLYFSNADNLSLVAYCDSDWAACPDSRRSVYGYVVFLGGSPISWKSTKQETISLSLAEAE